MKTAILIAALLALVSPAGAQRLPPTNPVHPRMEVYPPIEVPPPATYDADNDDTSIRRQMDDIRRNHERFLRPYEEQDDDAPLQRVQLRKFCRTVCNPYSGDPRSCRVECY